MLSTLAVLGPVAVGCNKAADTGAVLGGGGQQPPGTAPSVVVAPLDPTFTFRTRYTQPASEGGNHITRLTLSSDGQTMVVASWAPADSVQVWDLVKRETVKTILGNRLATASPDGTRLAHVAKRTILVRESRTGGNEVKLEHASGLDEVVGISFAPDGRKVVAATKTHIIVWAAGTGEKVADWPAGTDVNALSGYFADGARLATATEKGVITIWDVAGHMPVRTIEVPDKDRVEFLAASPDGRWLATASGWGEPKTRVWDLNTGALAHEFPANSRNSGSYAMVFLPDNRTLAYSDTDNGLVLFDVVEKSALRRCPGTPGINDRIFAVAVTPDGRRLAAGYEGGPVRVFDLK